MYSNMFQIYHDEENTKNVNLLNRSKHNIMMREKKIISSERNKKNILSSITNNNNVIFINEKTDRMKNHIHQQKTQSVKIQKKKQQLKKKKKKREDKDLKSKKLKKKKKKKKKQKQKSNNVLTSDIINNNHHPVVQYANTTSTIANQWEQEIEVIINMPIVNEEKILCYVQVYDEEVKTKYFNSVSRNLLSIYPQWQYIFEQQYNKNRQNYGNNNILSELHNHRTRTFINYVNVYDMRCKDQYYQLVRSNMFKKFPQWNLSLVLMYHSVLEKTISVRKV